MEIIAGMSDFYLEKETAVAIGKFDGVHIGHRRLLDEILLQKDRGLAACVFTFDPAPAVFFGQSDGKELTTREEKRLLFERMGIDILVEFPLNGETASIEPQRFAEEVLAERMNTCFLAAGTDLSFGAGGRGDAALLEALSPALGFQVKTIEKVCVDGQAVSSSRIRSQVEKGDMALVEQLLGMPYPIMGRVEHGKRIGRTIGFPTINLLPPADKLLPPNGVYLSEVKCRGRRYQAVSNVGCKPTVSSDRRMGVETYLYGFEGDLYGEDAEVYLKEFQRPEQKFDSLEELGRQLALDIEAGRPAEQSGGK